MAHWTIDSPGALELAGQPFRRLSVRILRGSVDVVAASGPARLEVTELDGPPLEISIEDGKLTVAHEQLTWAGILSWVTRDSRARARISLAVPPEVEVELGLVSASATVSGITGRTSVRSVSGEVTLDGCAAQVQAETVSGELEAHGLQGDLSFKSVSGELTVVGGSGGPVRAKSVSGGITLDLLDISGDLDLATVSGEVTVRLPEKSPVDVDVRSTSGDLRSGFPGLNPDDRPGKKRMYGRLGAGDYSLRAKTVSGTVTLLGREPA